MADSFAQILVHLTFHTKVDTPTILEEHLPRVFEYIGGEVRSLNGIPFAVGGRPDHIHILSTLPKWIKTVDDRYRLFAWQDGYGAFSVSYANKDRVVGYIANQEEHHKKKTFREEYIEFLKSNNIEYDERYV